jgi:hypothetical protein
MRKLSTEHAQVGRIEFKLRKVSQLFDTLDPSPFRESDLAVQAEDHIVDRALEFSDRVPVEIVIYLPSDELQKAPASDISGAIRSYFNLRSQAVSRELSELFKTGRLSLVVGMIILSICLLLGWMFSQHMTEGPFSRVLSESFLIFGWVAIWKPSEIFLYAWPPVAARRKLLRRLSEATVLLDADDRM